MPILGVTASSIFKGGSYESIASATGTGSSATITFSSIPSTYTHLQIRGVSELDTYASTINNITVRFNSDSGNNYAWHNVYGYNSATGASAVTTTNGMITWTALRSDSYYFKQSMIIDILDYTSTNKNKTLRSFFGVDYNALYQGYVGLASGVWLNTAAITSISLVGNFNFLTTTKVALYGIKGA